MASARESSDLSKISSKRCRVASSGAIPKFPVVATGVEALIGKIVALRPRREAHQAQSVHFAEAPPQGACLGEKPHVQHVELLFAGVQQA